MSCPKFNKYRAAIDVLQKGRDLMVDELADTVIDQSEDLLESGYAFHELLENQGTRLHFLCLLISQLEQSAEALDEAQVVEDEPALTSYDVLEVERRRPGDPDPDAEAEAEAETREMATFDGRVDEPVPDELEPADPPPSMPKRRPRAGRPRASKKLERQSSRERSPDEA